MTPRSPMTAAARMPATATKVRSSAGGVRKPSAKRLKVVEPLFAHGAAEGAWLQLRPWRLLAVRRRR